MTTSDSTAPAAQAALELDLRGLNCPLPVLKTTKALRGLKAGDRVLVLASDPLAAVDIPHFCREHGHGLLDTAREGTVLRFMIEKGAGQDG